VFFPAAPIFVAYALLRAASRLISTPPLHNENPAKLAAAAVLWLGLQSETRDCQGDFVGDLNKFDVFDFKSYLSLELNPELVHTLFAG